MTFLIAFTLNLQVLSVCLILDSHDSIFQLLEIKVSNLWEMRHISIWTYTVSNNNLSEHHERIFESDIFWSWILTDSFPPFHPSLSPFQSLASNSTWIRHFSSLYFFHQNMVILAIYFFLSSICLFCPWTYSISYYQKISIVVLQLWGFLDFFLHPSSSLITEVTPNLARRK